eukprot:1188371-Prorocentrum_minimum.AAC.2
MSDPKGIRRGSWSGSWRGSGVGLEWDPEGTRRGSVECNAFRVHSATPVLGCDSLLVTITLRLLDRCPLQTPSRPPRGSRRRGTRSSACAPDELTESGVSRLAVSPADVEADSSVPPGGPV